jgi:hypothetical protein|tara:strand:+ start:301 stop:450 length:150 start_codon:yes stop_codon:yes gene_type:complete
MKRFRTVSVYYRDEEGVMRKIPHVVAHLDKGSVFRVYTLPPVELQEMYI